MDVSLLEQAGLNATQGKAYIALITSGSLTPPSLAAKIGIARTNAYEVLKQLEELELVSKTGSGTKMSYRPANPAALERLMERRRNEVLEHEERLRSVMPQLMTYFYTYSEQPGVRFYQGKDGIIEVYEDILRTREPVLLIRTATEKSFLGSEFMARYIAQRVKLGITVNSLTPDIPEANHDTLVDSAQLLTRTWFMPSAISAPVEVDIYGDKTAFISFGEEAIATIVESPQIADFMRQAFAMMRLGAPLPLTDSELPQQIPKTPHSDQA